MKKQLRQLKDKYFELLYLLRYIQKTSNLKGVDLYINYPRRSLINKKIVKNILMGFYEQKEIAILKKTITKQDVVLELGTGLGYNSIYLRKVLGVEKIYTYEANPKMMPIIKSNFALNKVDIDAKNFVLTLDDEKQVELTITDEFWNSSQVKSAGREVVYVPTENINEIISKQKITYLLLDIEGGEKFIFRKGLNLQPVKKICVEIHPTIIGDSAVTEIVSFIIGNGFKINANAANSIKQMYFYKD